MNTEIFIVTYGRDFRYLKFALRSVSKYATGFAGCTVAIPERDLEAFKLLLQDPAINESIMRASVFDEWPEKGMLHHMYLILCADIVLPSAQRILHMDADCFFTRPVTPEDYMIDGKPVMVHAPYDWLIAQQSNLILWQQAVHRALGWKPVHEFMRRHPSVYNRYLYPETRTLISQHTGMSVEDYLKQQRNEFPQTFAEFPTLGEVAWTKFHDDYVWRDQSKGEWPEDNPMDFCWSHREPTPGDIEKFKKAGLT